MKKVKTRKELITKMKEELVSFFTNGYDEYEIDVIGYKMKWVNNPNQPTRIHFCKKDMKDKVSVSFINIFGLVEERKQEWLRKWKEQNERYRQSL